MRNVLSVVIVVLLTATAGLAFQRVFAPGDLLPVVAVAAIVPAALSALLSFPRSKPVWPLWTSLAAGAFAWLLVVTATLFRHYAFLGFLPSPQSFQAVGLGLRDSAKGMLTTILPAPATPQLLVLVHVLVWFGVLAGCEIALRSSMTAAPAIPAVVVFAAAVLFGVDGAGLTPAGIAVVATVVALIALLVTVRNGRSSLAGVADSRLEGVADSRLAGVADSSRRLAAGVIGAVVAGVFAGTVVPYLPVAAEPYDPRDHVEPPKPRRFKNPSPLDRVAGWLERDQPMFTVRANADPNWRIATLDRYDGYTWSSGAEFKPTGRRVPPSPYGSARHVQVEQEFTIQELPGVWLPAADRPETVEGLPVLVDQASGVIIRGTGGTGGKYRVSSSVPKVTADELAGATTSTGGELPPLPDGKPAKEAEQLTRLATAWTKGAGSPFGQARMLRDRLRTFKNDPTAPPGHTYAQLIYFLRQRSGTTEQFGTAFALLARALGMDSRVVVGFRPGVEKNGVRQVKSGDVLVWAEIKFDGIGWYRFDPTPRSSDASTGRSPPSGSAEDQEKAESKVDPAKPPKQSPTPTPPAAKPRARDLGTLWKGLAYGAAWVPVAYTGLVMVVPWWRRRRRRSGSPGERIGGAWAATLEDLGLRSVESETAHDVATLGRRRVGREGEPHLHRLADLINLARFGDQQLPDRSGELAWQDSDAVRRLIHRRSGFWRRVLRRLHPRSLRR